MSIVRGVLVITERSDPAGGEKFDIRAAQGVDPESDLVVKRKALPRGTESIIEACGVDLECQRISLRSVGEEDRVGIRLDEPTGVLPAVLFLVRVENIRRRTVCESVTIDDRETVIGQVLWFRSVVEDELESIGDVAVFAFERRRPGEHVGHVSDS